MRIPVLLALATQVVFGQASLTVENAADANVINPFADIGVRRIAPGSLVRLTFHPGPGDASVTDLSRSKVSIRALDSGRVFGVQVIQAPRQLAPIIAYVLPETPLGNADVILEIDDRTTVLRRIQLVPSSLAVFKKRGAADAQNIRANGTSAQNGLTAPAYPGDYVTIWATGLGTAAEKDVSVFLGGRQATVNYAGPAPGLTGVNQINFKIPDDPRIPDACYLELSVLITNNLADRTSITKTNTADVCTHPLGLDREQLSRLDAGGVAPIGSMAVSSSIYEKTELLNTNVFQLGYVRRDTASASFQELDAAAIARRTGLTGSAGTPTATIRFGDFSAFNLPAATLDAGPQLTLTRGWNFVHLTGAGPSGFVTYSANLPETAPVSDPGTLAGSRFSGGDWTFRGTGGADIDAFARTVQISPAIRFKKVPAFPESIDTKTDQIFEWDPIGYADDEIVLVSLGIVTQTSPEFMTAGPRVAVMAPARTGRAVLPARLLAALTPAAANPLTTGSLSISFSKSGGQFFTVPLKRGETVPVRFDNSSSEQVSVLVR